MCKGTGNTNEHPTHGILVGVSSGYLVGKSCLFTRVSTFYHFIDDQNAVLKKPDTIRSLKNTKHTPSGAVRIEILFCVYLIEIYFVFSCFLVFTFYSGGHTCCHSLTA